MGRSKCVTDVETGKGSELADKQSLCLLLVAQIQLQLKECLFLRDIPDIVQKQNLTGLQRGDHIPGGRDQTGDTLHVSHWNAPRHAIERLNSGFMIQNTRKNFNDVGKST